MAQETGIGDVLTTDKTRRREKDQQTPIGEFRNLKREDKEYFTAYRESGKTVIGKVGQKPASKADR